jgi:small-conductance mechanosensitive channel
VLGRSVGTWLLAAGIGLASLLAAKLARWIARRVLAKSSKDKVLKEFLVAASGYAAYLLGLAGIAATLGMTLPTLLSSLGLTTLALTLALQAPISNIAGGIYLLASEPFAVGERIRVTAWDGLEGTVKEVSLTQTTLLGEDGRVVVVPNSRFVTDAIHKLDAGKEAFAPARRTASARRGARWYAWLAAAAMPAAYLAVRFWLGDAARWLAVLAVAGGAWLAARAVRKAVELALRRSSKGPMFRSILVTLSGFGVYAAAAFVIAHMLGVSLPGLLGGLGVTSIAVGFALRGFLENIVGGLHVLQAGLFSMGDHLQAGVWESLRGHVEDITLTHTRLRADDRAILVPNSRFLDGGVIRYPEGWVPPPPKDAPAPPGPGPR